MTHVSDRYWTGATFTNLRPPGVATSPIYVFSVVPETLQTDNIALSAVVSGAPASFTLAAGTGVTTTSINGTTYLDLGVARTVVATGAGASTAAISLTVNGIEEIVRVDGTRGPGSPMTQTFTGPSGTAATATTKAFRYVGTATASGNSVSGISLGTGDTIGMPYFVGNFEAVRLAYNSAGITSSAGFTAGDTTTATATTGDVRGTYLLPTAADGAKRLSAWIFIADPDTSDGAYGVAQA